MKTKPAYIREFLHHTALTAGAFAAVPTTTSAAAGRTTPFLFGSIQTR